MRTRASALRQVLLDAEPRVVQVATVRALMFALAAVREHVLLECCFVRERRTTHFAFQLAVLARGVLFFVSL